MILEPFEILNGIFSVIFVIIATIVGLRIASKYFETKQKIFLCIGIAWVGMAIGWWPSSVSFILVITTGTLLSEELYFLIGCFLMPWFLNLWIIGVTELMYKKRQKIILIITFVIALIYDYFLIYFIINDPSQIGVLHSPVDVEYTGINKIFMIYVLLTAGISGILFGRHSLKSNNPELRLKGKIIIASYTSWMIAAISDAIIPLNYITLPVIRILLISSAIGYYFAFFLPKWLKKSEWEIEILEEAEGEKDEVEEFLKLIEAKPKKITEEEIMFFRERKICLVCKGKASGFIFLCEKCDALYCKKCVEALVTLENLCWACNEPLDKTKPVKAYEKADEDIEITSKDDFKK